MSGYEYNRLPSSHTNAGGAQTGNSMWEPYKWIKRDTAGLKLCCSSLVCQYFHLVLTRYLFTVTFLKPGLIQPKCFPGLGNSGSGRKNLRMLNTTFHPTYEWIQHTLTHSRKKILIHYHYPLLLLITIFRVFRLFSWWWRTWHTLYKFNMCKHSMYIYTILKSVSLLYKLWALVKKNKKRKKI